MEGPLIVMPADAKRKFLRSGIHDFEVVFVLSGPRLLLQMQCTFLSLIAMPTGSRSLTDVIAEVLIARFEFLFQYILFVP